MFKHSSTIRVRYAETDKMGFVYYGNYAVFFEVARVEAMRHLGISYKSLEDKGILMPVIEYNTKYLKPAKYDDLLTINVIIRKMPSLKIAFEYEVYNEEKTLLNLAETTLVFLDKQTYKPQPVPDELVRALNPYFEE
jgi:acyl-CoA thioester hydrolase